MEAQLARHARLRTRRERKDHHQSLRSCPGADDRRRRLRKDRRYYPARPRANRSTGRRCSRLLRSNSCHSRSSAARSWLIESLKRKTRPRAHLRRGAGCRSLATSARGWTQNVSAALIARSTSVSRFGGTRNLGKDRQFDSRCCLPAEQSMFNLKQAILILVRDGDLSRTSPERIVVCARCSAASAPS